MAAGTWKIYTQAKRLLGEGALTLNTGVWRMTLHSIGASANILRITNGGISTYGSIGSELNTSNGYPANGRSITEVWTVGASTKQMKYSYQSAGVIFTASGGSLSSIKYAAIRNSTGAGAGKVLCFVTLSTTPFTITSGNTLTISPHASGVFTLA